MFIAYARLDNSRHCVVLAQGSERDCRRKASAFLGTATLRGLAQAPTEEGVRFYGRGGAEDGESVEICRL